MGVAFIRCDQNEELRIVRLVMLGGPGAGKGTQSQRLSDVFGIPLISIGNILREAITEGTPLGLTAAAYVDKGELVPDETMIEFIRRRLMKPDVDKGWILDGYPRTAFQAEELDFLLDELGQKLDWAIWLNTPTGVLMSRSLARGREDDTEEVIRRRIELFHQRTMPMLEYYSRRLLTVYGEQAPEAVEQEIVRLIG